MPKLIDLLSTRSPEDRPLVSLEYFPPRTDEGVKSLKDRMERMKTAVSPLFTDITWGAGGSTAGLSMDLAIYMQNSGHTANLHMTCTNIKDSENPVADIQQALQTALDNGITNIVALRGDPPAGETEWKAAENGFSCALDLVKFMRNTFGDAFGISVAGYPEGHPNAISLVDDLSALTATELARSSTDDEGKTYTCLDADYKKEIEYLKEKVDAGADLIITQMFFDAAVYHQFVKDCREAGIQCPIIPGLMCVTGAAGFLKMTKFCKTRVPPALKERVQNATDTTQIGIDIGTELSQHVLTGGSESPPALHFYTLNLEKVVYGILQNLGWMERSIEPDEDDAALQVATGSAWARIGDSVSTHYGTGVVVKLDSATAAAAVELSNWVMANNQKPIAYLQKGQYQKVFQSAH